MTSSTKTGQAIVFKQAHLAQGHMHESVVLWAMVDGEMAGYIKLMYVSQQWAGQHMRSAMDFFMYKINHANEKLLQAYQAGDMWHMVEHCHGLHPQLAKNKQLLADCSTEEVHAYWQEIEQVIQTRYLRQFEQFVEYWVDKPSAQIICVFDSSDKHAWNFEVFPHEKIARGELRDWRGQGIGIALYHQAAQWCQDHGMKLWASNNQTEDGKKMWKIMREVPLFYLEEVEQRAARNNQAWRQSLQIC